MTAANVSHQRNKFGWYIHFGSQDIRKILAASLIGATVFAGAGVRAEIDYSGLPYLGGSEKIDLNNANIRVYAKIPGFYPNLASKIVNNGPYKSAADVYNIPGLSSAEKDTLKKYESRFLFLAEKPEYVVDKINNG